MVMTPQEELVEVLSNAYYCMDLYRFAKGQFSEENIVFLLAVRQLNPTLGYASRSVLPAKLLGDTDRARYIYDRFVGDDGARNLINLPNAIFILVRSRSGNLGRNSFDEAYAETLGMVAADTFSRFKLEYKEELVLGSRDRR
jgi:hypothetical protein